VTSLVDRRDLAAVTVARGAGFVLGCFFVGVFAVRDPVRGVMLIAALACLVVYLTRPQWMAWIAFFLAFASLPPTLPVGNGLWPLGMYTYQTALVLAIAFLVPRARLRFSEYLLPGIFVLTVAYFTAVGLAGGNDPARVNREALFLVELAAGFVLALLIVRADYVREAIWAIGAVLWFSAGMILLSSLTGLKLMGRAVSLQAETGAAQAVRLITFTETPALAVLAALVASQIVGRGRLSVHLALGLPALLITLLAFSRGPLIVLGVTVAIALLASLGWSALRRSAALVAVVAALVAVVVPAALFLLHNTGAGAWIGDQLNAYSNRVFGGVSPTALAIDNSTQDRLREDDHLLTAIADSPLLGHGMGYAYQLPFGKAGTFTATLGTTYAHNFYLWWLAKAGAVGMASFALFALTPVVKGIRSASAASKISAAVSAGLLAGCAVGPMPEEPVQALVLGLALGAALGFARARPHSRLAESTDPASPTSTASYV
jgi:O-antigen ligase